MYLFLMSAEQAQGQPGLLDFLMPFILVFFIMWLLVIRPQRKEQKARQKMLENLKKGDTVVTSGGMIGKVMKLREDRIELKVDESNNTKITFLRSAVMNVIPKEQKNK